MLRCFRAKKREKAYSPFKQKVFGTAIIVVSYFILSELAGMIYRYRFAKRSKNELLLDKLLINSAIMRTLKSAIAGTAASMLGWLQHNGCTLSDNTTRRLADIRAIDPSWDERWKSNADQSLDARVGYVSVKTDPSKILDLPIPQIIEAADQHSVRPFMEFAEYRPFSGLVKQRPQRALAALAYQARRGNFPLSFWQTALADWPDDLPERIQWLFAARLAQLPRDTISGLPHYAPRWLKSNLPKLALGNSARALAIWDKIFDALISIGGKAVESGMGDVFIGGKAQNYSRRTYQHAINGPIGIMTEALLQILGDRKSDPMQAFRKISKSD